jgi:hypothetical protein
LKSALRGLYHNPLGVLVAGFGGLSEPCYCRRLSTAVVAAAAAAASAAADAVEHQHPERGLCLEVAQLCGLANRCQPLESAGM